MYEGSNKSYRFRIGGCLIITQLLFVISSWSQNYELIGRLDNQIVSIDSTTGVTSIYKDLVNFSGEDLRDLIFHNTNELYYSIKDPNDSPTLVSISQNAEYAEVGPLTLNGSQILLAESLAYNKEDDKLYGGVSLDGGIANGDFYSETIVEVDPATGNCTFVTELTTNRLNPDADVLVFDGNRLYIADGAPPNLNFLSIYRLDFTSLGATSSPVELYASTYLPIHDFAIMGQNIFLVEDRNLRQFVIQRNTIQFIGVTHLVTEFNGNVILGLSKREACELAIVDIGDDQPLCNNESLLLDATVNDGLYQWQDGSTEPTYLVTQPGDYWVEVETPCGVTRDSISVFQPAPTAFVPNIFTPNGDGVNDVFEIQSDQGNIDLKIYNRWGKNVYQSPDYQNNWNGDGLPGGIYFYLVTDACGTYKGWVNILYVSTE